MFLQDTEVNEGKKKPKQPELILSGATTLNLSVARGYL